MNYEAIGYHGTDKEGARRILNEGIDFQRRGEDVFLGRGFYVWRDSYARAKRWKRSEEVIEVKISCKRDEMLNFTSRDWNDEKGILEIYFHYFKQRKVYLGEFIDLLIDHNVDIKLVTIFDMTNKRTKIHIQDPYNKKDRTIFAYGDIQICLKSDEVIVDKRKVTNNDC
jgi:hypothetical protein